jgi:hypothetical protein
MKHLGRKLYHVLGGAGLLAIWFSLGRPRAFAAYAVLLGAALLFDLARFALPRFNAWAMAHLSGFLRPGEERAGPPQREPDRQQPETAEDVVELAAEVPHRYPRGPRSGGLK